LKLIIKGIFGGIFLAMACAATQYLEPVAAALIFPFALTMIIATKSKLTTACIMDGTVEVGRRPKFTPVIILEIITIWALNFIGVYLVAHFIPPNAAKIDAKLTQTTIHIFTSGIFCNILVCLGTYLGREGKNIIETYIGCLIPVSLFILCGFDHSVANLYWAYATTGIQFWTIPLTALAGNVVGGVIITIMLGELKWVKTK